MTKPLSDRERAFLRRFVGRGWLHADREDPEAVAGWLARFIEQRRTLCPPSK